VTDFLLRTQDGWAGDFALPAGKNYYSFLVDGANVLDPANPEAEEVMTEDGKFKFNFKMVR